MRKIFKNRGGREFIKSIKEKSKTV